MIEELGLTDLQIKMEPVSDAQQIAGAAENTVLRQLLSGNEIAEGTEVNNGMVLTLEVAAAGSYDSGQSVNMMNLIGQAFQDAKATNLRILYWSKVWRKENQSHRELSLMLRLVREVIF